jgi:hypothetical protein
MMTARATARLHGWLRLAASLLAIAVFVALVHAMSPVVPGPAGAIFEHNMSEDVDAAALFYSEVTDIREFLDAEHGRYGSVGRRGAAVEQGRAEGSSR